MSYTPTTWTTGDTVTATKMNKLEQGVANTAPAKVSISATGYGSATRLYGKLVYAVNKNNTWVVITDDDSNNWFWINGFGNNPYYNVLPPHLTLVSEDMCPFLVEVQANAINTTGSISSTAEAVYYNYGSSILGGGYRISGDCSIQFVAD